MNHSRKSTQRSDSGNQQSDLVYCGIIFVAGALAYSSSFAGIFLFDDHPCIVDNESLRSFAAIWSATGDEIPNGLQRRPVVRWSLALNYGWGEADPWGYHAVNLLIHLTAGLFLFGIVKRTLMLPKNRKRLNANASAFAFAVALLWVVHPLQTESVTYIIQRLESMMGMFYLGCIYCVLRGSQADKPLAWYAAAVACCWLGMGSKEVMITAPVVLILFDRVFLSKSWKELFRRRGWMYLAFAPAVGWLVATVLFGAPSEEPTNVAEFDALQRVDRWSYLFTQPGVLLYYMWLSIWPLELCFDYWWPVARHPLEIVLPGAVILSLLGVSAAALRYRPRLGFLGLSFFLVLAPTSSVIPLHIAFEHRMYLSLAPIFVLLVLAGDELFHRLQQRGYLTDSSRKVVARAAVLLIAIGFGWLTFERNKVYHNPIRFWGDVVEKTSPENARACNELGIAYYEEGNFDEALKHCKEAIRRNPNLALAHYNFGNTQFYGFGHLDEAIESYEEAIRLNENLFGAHVNLGRVLHELGKLDDAATHYETALRIIPDAVDVYVNLGNLYRDQGKPNEAVKSYVAGLKIDSSHVNANYSLAYTLHFMRGDLDNAIFHYRLAIHFDQKNFNAFNNLGTALYQKGQPMEAIRSYQQALRINSRFADAHVNLAKVLLERGEVDSAMEHCRIALGINPSMAHAHFHLGVAYMQRDSEKSKFHFKKAIQLDSNLRNAVEGYRQGAKGKD